MVDKCVGCEGLFFDRGELELMLVNKKALGPLRKLFN
jgi:Zn-finger nucleic acid-binding protein